MATIPAFVLPLHFLAILATGWLVSMGLLWFIMDLRHYGKEGFDFRKCRKNNIPYFIDVDIGSGSAVGYAAEKTKKGAGRIFHKSEAGAKIDPSISMGNDEPIRLPRGLEIQLHGTLDAWPTSLRNAAGIAKIKEIRRLPEYSPLDAIPDKELIELLDTPDDHLSHDVKLFIERYKIPNPEADPEHVKAVNAKLDAILRNPAHRVVNWLRRDDLATMLLAEEADVDPLLELMIMKYWKGTATETPPEFSIAVHEKLAELRQDPIVSTIVSPIIPTEQMLELINGLKAASTHAIIDPKFCAFRSALKDNPNAFKTTDVTTLENILRQMMIEDLLNKIQWMQWGMIIVAIIVAGAVSSAIVVSVIK
jgi:hypothetical protein